MGYRLGVDLGTTFTAAAVCRDGRAEMASLGNRAASIPSIVYLKEDETILTGDSAERRATTEPGRVAREFKRRLGDPTPILLGNTPYSAEALLAKLLRWTIDAVSEREGGRPDSVAVTHPANWGPYKKDLFTQTVRLANLDEAASLTEPEAAAIYYASNERVEVGSLVAVYDLGGGTFDATVLRKTASGFEILGNPEGIERLGGIDFDEAVFSYVDQALDGAISKIDPTDPLAVSAVARLRADCVLAKESLSSDTDTTIPVMLPNLTTQVRLTRAEFEAMIRPTLVETIGSLSRALRSANVEPSDVDAVLLVGGSSRIPLVAQLVSAEVGRPVAVDAHPKYAIPLGAALAAANGSVGRARPNGHAAAVSVPGAAPDASGPPVQQWTPEPASPEPASPEPASPEPVTTEPVTTEPVTTEPVSARSAAPPPAPVAVPEPASATEPAAPAPPPAPPITKARPPIAMLAAAVGLVGLGIAAFLVFGPGDDPSEDPAGDAAAAPADPAGEPPPVDPLPPGDHVAAITGIDIANGSYLARFDVRGFEPRLGQGNLHLHFFFDTVAPEQAGVPGRGPWKIHPAQDGVVGSSPFTMYAVSERPSAASRMCVLVANADHSVIPGSGACHELP